MDEGGLYDIKHALVVPNDGKGRVTRHAFRLVFQKRYEITITESHSFTSYGLTPVTSTELSRNKTETEYLVDKVGLLTKLSCEREYVKGPKDNIALFLELTDPTGKIECVLYDEYVEDLHQYLRREGPMTPIIVVQFARVVPVGTVLFGDAGIETVVGISRVLFYPGIPEVFQMNHWLTMSGINIEGKVEYIDMGTPSNSLRDEFLLYYPRRELNHLTKRGGGGLIVVWGRVIGLVEGERWWNSSCTHQQCSAIGSCIYTCDGHYSIVPRYSVKVEVCDEKHVIHLMLGDEDVEQMVNKPCKDLLSAQRDTSLGTYPGVFNLLLGKELLFLVEKRNSINDITKGCFRVRKVCADREIIRMFATGDFLRVDRNTRTTIARLLGEKGAAQHFNVPYGSSFASALPGDNFTSAGSDASIPSSSASVSLRNMWPNFRSEDEDDEAIDKHCVFFTSSSNRLLLLWNVLFLDNLLCFGELLNVIYVL